MAQAELSGLDVVVYYDGRPWGFHLPDQHTVTLLSDSNLALLSLPDRGAGYALQKVEQVGPETHVYIGRATGDGHALLDLPIEYPIPEIQEEIERLKARWENAGGRPTDFNAWQKVDGQDEPWEGYLARQRAALREMEGGAKPAARP